MAEESPLKLGEFADYELLTEVSHGGMGVVYQARQRSLDRIVALKMLLGGQFAEPQARARFRSEAEIAARLQHANIVAVHEVGEHDHLPFFTMDYVEGRSLAELARDRPLTPAVAAGYLSTIARAIAYAHGHGVLHRDLKPSNILIDGSDQPRITDFGLAKLLIGSTTSLTLSSEALGSPNFMPPEQAAGKHKLIGPVSDVYGLGAVLYFLVTSRPPFIADNLTVALRQVQEQEPISPRMLNPGVPKDLETICLKCLQKEPPKRYQSAADLADELDRFRRGEPILARPVGPVGRSWRWCRRRPELAVAFGVCIALLFAGVVGVIAQWRRAELESQHQRRLAYEADMNLIQQAIAVDNLGRARFLLGRHRPSRGETDLRKWEWRMLKGLVLPDSLRTVGRHVGEVKALGFAGNDRLITGNFDEERIAVWNLALNQLVEETAPAHVYDLSVHPSGRVFAVAGFRAQVDLYRLDPLQRFAALPAKGLAATVRFSPDGSHLAALSADRLWLWHLTWGPDHGLIATDLVAELPTSSFWPMAFTPDGGRLAYWHGGEVMVYSLQERQSVSLPPRGGAVSGLAFSPDQRWLAVAGFDGKLVLIDLQSHEFKLLHQYEQPLRVVAFSPDGSALVTAGVSGVLHVWDLPRQGERSALRGHTELVSAMAFAPNGRLLATGSKDSTCRVWDITQKPRRSECVQETVGSYVIGQSPNSRFFLTIEGDGRATLWDLREGQKCRRLHNPLFGNASMACITSSGSRALVACPDRGIIQLDLEQPDAPALLAITNEVQTLTYSDDGSLFAIAADDQPVRVFDSDTAQLKAILQPPPNLPSGAVGRMAFGVDHRILFIGVGRYLLRFNIESGELTANPRLAHLRAFGVWRTPKGDVVATLGTDDRLHIWDSKTLAPLVNSLTCYGDWGNVAFDGAGERIFVTASAGRVAVFDTVTAAQLTLLEPGLRELKHLQFSPESDTLVVFGLGEADKLQLWRAPSFAEIEAAEMTDDGLRLLQPLSHP
jgi:WD40 repeat protein